MRLFVIFPRMLVTNIMPKCLFDVVKYTLYKSSFPQQAEWLATCQIHLLAVYVSIVLAVIAIGHLQRAFN